MTAHRNVPVVTSCILLLAAGCGGKRLPRWPSAVLPEAHVVAVNERGETVDPARWPKVVSPERFEQQLDRMFQRMDAWHAGRDEGTAAKPRKILIFVHGGLTTPQDGLGHACWRYDDILEAGYYPIFIVWNPELWSSWGEHVWFVRQGEYRRTSPHLGPFIVLADLGRALLRAPVTWSFQGGHDVRRLGASFQATQENKPENRWLENVEFTKVRRISRWFIRAYENPYAREETFPISMGRVDAEAGSAWRTTEYVVSIPTKYALSPLLDAGGSSAWDNMCRRAMVMSEGFTASWLRGEKRTASVANPGDSALVRLIKRLEERAPAGGSAGPAKTAYEITLVGHSMGAIVLNEFVHRSERVEYNNIVYLAAACSVRDFQRTVVGYLDRHRLTRFYNLCLHPVNETRERNAELVAPRGSLLVWIDDMFSRPHTTLDRTLGRWQNLAAVSLAVPKHLRPRVTLKAFAVLGTDQNFPMYPQKHGHFGGQKYWLPEFWEPEPICKTLKNTEPMLRKAEQEEENVAQKARAKAEKASSDRQRASGAAQH